MFQKAISLAFILLTTTSAAMAQDVWQAPKKAQKVETSAKTKKTKKEKSADKAEKKDVSTPKAKKTKIDPKYAEGAIPEVNGKIEWQWTFDMPGRTAEKAYEEMMVIIDSLTVQPEQTDRSQIAVVNPKERIIAANMVEVLDFTKNALSHDFTIFRYALICQTFEGKAVIKICRLIYDYEKDRPTGATYVAEEWITDRVCLNKSKTKLYPSNGKFRRKTIDRMGALHTYIDHAIRLNK